MIGPLVLGCDPALANFGWALARLLPRGEEIVAMGVIRTEASDKKAGVLVADDTFRRAQEIGMALLSVLAKHGASFGYGQPPEGRIRAICYEALSLPPNSSAGSKIGFAFGVLAALSIANPDAGGVATRCASPQALKKAVAGNGSASKADVARALGARYGLASFESKARKPMPMTAGPDPLHGIPVGFHEHGWDALGAIVACLDTDIIRALRPAA